jgi:hypothetical protein
MRQHTGWPFHQSVASGSELQHQTAEGSDFVLSLLFVSLKTFGQFTSCPSSQLYLEGGKPASFMLVLEDCYKVFCLLVGAMSECSCKS